MQTNIQVLRAMVESGGVLKISCLLLLKCLATGNFSSLFLTDKAFCRPTPWVWQTSAFKIQRCITQWQHCINLDRNLDRRHYDQEELRSGDLSIDVQIECSIGKTLFVISVLLKKIFLFFLVQN